MAFFHATYIADLVFLVLAIFFSDSAVGADKIHVVATRDYPKIGIKNAIAFEVCRETIAKKEHRRSAELREIFTSYAGVKMDPAFTTPQFLLLRGQVPTWRSAHGFVLIYVTVDFKRVFWALPTRDAEISSPQGFSEWVPNSPAHTLPDFEFDEDGFVQLELSFNGMVRIRVERQIPKVLFANQIESRFPSVHALLSAAPPPIDGFQHGARAKNALDQIEVILKNKSLQIFGLNASEASLDELTEALERKISAVEDEYQHGLIDDEEREARITSLLRNFSRIRAFLYPSP